MVAFNIRQEVYVLGQQSCPWIFLTKAFEAKNVGPVLLLRWIRKCLMCFPCFTFCFYFLLASKCCQPEGKQVLSRLPALRCHGPPSAGFLPEQTDHGGPQISGAVMVNTSGPTYWSAAPLPFSSCADLDRIRGPLVKGAVRAVPWEWSSTWGSSSHPSWPSVAAGRTGSCVPVRWTGVWFLAGSAFFRYINLEKLLPVTESQCAHLGMGWMITLYNKWLNIKGQYQCLWVKNEVNISFPLFLPLKCSSRVFPL